MVCTTFLLFTIVHLNNFGKFENVCRGTHIPSVGAEMSCQSKVGTVCHDGTLKSTWLGTSSKVQQLQNSHNKHGTNVETIFAELEVRHTGWTGISQTRGTPGDVNQHILRTQGYKRSGRSVSTVQGIVKNCLASQVCTKSALGRRVQSRRSTCTCTCVHVRAKLYMETACSCTRTSWCAGHFTQNCLMKLTSKPTKWLPRSLCVRERTPEVASASQVESRELWCSCTSQLLVTKFLYHEQIYRHASGPSCRSYHQCTNTQSRKSYESVVRSCPNAVSKFTVNGEIVWSRHRHTRRDKDSPLRICRVQGEHAATAVTSQKLLGWEQENTSSASHVRASAELYKAKEKSSFFLCTKLQL